MIYLLVFCSVSSIKHICLRTASIDEHECQKEGNQHRAEIVICATLSSPFSIDFEQEVESIGPLIFRLFTGIQISPVSSLTDLRLCAFLTN